MASSNRWSVSGAKQQLSSVLRAASGSPQLIFSHSRLVGAVVSPAALQTIEARNRKGERPSLAEVFGDLRRLCEEEGYSLEVGERANRADSFSGDDDSAAG